jgi:hypothetical protein
MAELPPNLPLFGPTPGPTPRTPRGRAPGMPPNLPVAPPDPVDTSVPYDTLNEHREVWAQEADKDIALARARGPVNPAAVQRYHNLRRAQAGVLTLPDKAPTPKATIAGATQNMAFEVLGGTGDLLDRSITFEGMTPSGVRGGQRMSGPRGADSLAQMHLRAQGGGDLIDQGFVSTNAEITGAPVTQNQKDAATIGQAAATILNPPLTLSLMGMSKANQSLEEAEYRQSKLLNEGDYWGARDVRDNAVPYALAGAAAEVVPEALGYKFAKGLVPGAEKIIGRAPTPLGRLGTRAAIAGAVEPPVNALEEMGTQFLDNTAAYAFGIDPDRDLSQGVEEAGRAGLIGGAAVFTPFSVAQGYAADRRQDASLQRQRLSDRGGAAGLPAADPVQPQPAPTETAEQRAYAIWEREKDNPRPAEVIYAEAEGQLKAEQEQRVQVGQRLSQFGFTPAQPTPEVQSKLDLARQELADEYGTDAPLVLAEPTLPEDKYARSVAKRMGVDMLFVATADGSELPTNAHVGRNDPNTILVNVERNVAEDPIGVLFTHEVLHTIDKQDRTSGGKRWEGLRDWMNLVGLGKEGRNAYRLRVNKAVASGVITAEKGRELLADIDTVGREGVSEVGEVVARQHGPTGIEFLHRLEAEEPGVLQRLLDSVRAIGLRVAAAMGSVNAKQKIRLQEASQRIEAILRQAMESAPQVSQGGTSQGVQASLRTMPASNYGYWYDTNDHQWHVVDSVGDHGRVATELLETRYGMTKAQLARGLFSDSYYPHKEAMGRGLIRVVYQGGALSIQLPEKGVKSLGNIDSLARETLKNGQPVIVELGDNAANHSIRDPREWARFAASVQQGGLQAALKTLRTPRGPDAKVASLMTVENIPHPTSGELPGLEAAPFAVRSQFTKEVEDRLRDRTGQERLARAAGIHTMKAMAGPGLFKGQVNPGRQIPFRVRTEHMTPDGRLNSEGRRAVDGWAAARGLLTRQAAMAYHAPVPVEREEDANAVDFAIGGRQWLKREEVRPLYNALVDAFGEEVADSLAVVPVPHGVRFLNTTGLPNMKFLGGVERAFDIAFPGVTATEWLHGWDGNYLENDWSVNRNGEDYQTYVDASGAPDLQAGVRDVGMEIESLLARYRGRFGGGRALHLGKEAFARTSSNQGVAQAAAEVPAQQKPAASLNASLKKHSIVEGRHGMWWHPEHGYRPVDKFHGPFAIQWLNANDPDWVDRVNHPSEMWREMARHGWVRIVKYKNGNDVGRVNIGIDFNEWTPDYKVAALTPLIAKTLDAGYRVSIEKGGQQQQGLTLNTPEDLKKWAALIGTSVSSLDRGGLTASIKPRRFLPGMSIHEHFENTARQVDIRTGQEVIPKNPLRPTPSEIAWVKGHTAEDLIEHVKSQDKDALVGEQAQIYFQAKLKGLIAIRVIDGIEDIIAGGPGDWTITLKDTEMWVDPDVRTANHARLLGEVAAFDEKPQGQKVTYDPGTRRSFVKDTNQDFKYADRVVITSKGMFATGIRGEDRKLLASLPTTKHRKIGLDYDLPKTRNGFWVNPKVSLEWSREDTYEPGKGMVVINRRHADWMERYNKHHGKLLDGDPMMYGYQGPQEDGWIRVNGDLKTYANFNLLWDHRESLQMFDHVVREMFNRDRPVIVEFSDIDGESAKAMRSTVGHQYVEIDPKKGLTQAVREWNKITGGRLTASIKKSPLRGFHLMMDQVIEKVPKKIPAKDLVGFVKQRGVKPIEARWLGLEDLAAKGGTLTREQVKEWVDSHRVSIEETEQTGSHAEWASYVEPGGVDKVANLIFKLQNFSPAYINENMQTHKFGSNVLAFARVTFRDDTMLVEELQSDWADAGRKSVDRVTESYEKPTGKWGVRHKWSKLDGHGIEFPSREAAEAHRVVTPGYADDETFRKHKELGVKIADLEDRISAAREAYQTALNRVSNKIQDEIESAARGSRMSYPEIARYNELTGRGGSLTEAERSEWATLHARSEAVRQTSIRDAEQEARQHPEVSPLRIAMLDLTAEQQRLSEERRQMGTKFTPEPPFPEDTDWATFVMKRLIAYAAENGVEKIAFTTGQQQAKRWSQALADAADSVEWTENGALKVFKDGKLIQSKYISEGELHKYVGVKLSDAILEKFYTDGDGEEAYQEKVRVAKEIHEKALAEYEAQYAEAKRKWEEEGEGKPTKSVDEDAVEEWARDHVDSDDYMQGWEFDKEEDDFRGEAYESVDRDDYASDRQWEVREVDYFEEAQGQQFMFDSVPEVPAGAKTKWEIVERDSDTRLEESTDHEGKDWEAPEGFENLFDTEAEAEAALEKLKEDEVLPKDFDEESYLDEVDRQAAKLYEEARSAAYDEAREAGFTEAVQSYKEELLEEVEHFINGEPHSLSRRQIEKFIREENPEPVYEPPVYEEPKREHSVLMPLEGQMVGGEGMREFYDRKLGSVVSKMAKQFGAKIEPEIFKVTVGSQTRTYPGIKVTDQMKELAPPSKAAEFDATIRQNPYTWEVDRGVSSGMFRVYHQGGAHPATPREYEHEDEAVAALEKARADYLVENFPGWTFLKTDNGFEAVDPEAVISVYGENMVALLVKAAKKMDTGYGQTLEFKPQKTQPLFSVKKRRYNPGETKTGRKMIDGVDDARDARGDVLHDEEAVAAAERLLRGDTASLFERVRRGEQLDATETIAAKRLIAEATRNVRALSPEDRLKVVDLVDGYRETGRDQARALRVRGAVASMSRSDRVRQWLATEVFSLPSKLDRAVRDKPARRAKAREAWAKKVGDLLASMATRGIDLDDVMADPSNYSDTQLHGIAREVQTRKSDLGDMVYEAWINFILSMPTTHVSNVVGNATNVGLEYLINRPVEASINLLANDPGMASFGELPHLLRRVPTAAGQAARFWLMAMRTESPAFESNVTGGEGTEKTEIPKAIPGKIGKAVRFLGGRMLTAEDEFFKAFVANLEVAAHAHRIAKGEGLTGEALRSRMDDLIEQPEVWLNALDDAKRLTFQTEPGDVLRHFVQFRDSAHRAMFKAPVPVNPKYAVPFTTTIANLMTSGFRKTPVFTPKFAFDLMRHATERARGLEPTKSNSEMARGAADQLIAYGLLVMLAAATDDDEDDLPRITGTVPWRGTSRGERDTANLTVPAMSIRVGGKTISYARWEPFATSMATIIDLIGEGRRLREGKTDSAEVAGKAVAKLIDLMKEKSFAQGLAELHDALTDTRSVADFTSKYYSGFVPNVVRGAARSGDEFVRDQKVAGKGSQFYKDLLDKSKYRAFPSEGNAPPPMVDRWGREVRKLDTGSKAGNVANRMLNPFEVRDVQATPLDTMLLKWNKANPGDAYNPSRPNRHYTRGGETHYMTDDEYHRFSVESGQEAFRILSRLNLNLSDPTARDIEKVKTVLSKSRAKWRKDNLRVDKEDEAKQ